MEQLIKELKKCEAVKRVDASTDGSQFEITLDKGPVYTIDAFAAIYDKARMYYVYYSAPETETVITRMYLRNSDKYAPTWANNILQFNDKKISMRYVPTFDISNAVSIVDL